MRINITPETESAGLNAHKNKTHKNKTHKNKTHNNKPGKCVGYWHTRPGNEVCRPFLCFFSIFVKKNKNEEQTRFQPHFEPRYANFSGFWSFSR